MLKMQAGGWQSHARDCVDRVPHEGGHEGLSEFRGAHRPNTSYLKNFKSSTQAEQTPTGCRKNMTTTIAGTATLSGAGLQRG